MPLTQLSTLVLPAPFGPISARQLAALDRERDAVEHDEAAEPQPQILDRKLSHTISGCADTA